MNQLRRREFALLLVIGLLVSLSVFRQPSANAQESTASPTPTITPSDTTTATETLTGTPTETPLVSPTETATVIVGITPTPLPTVDGSSPTEQPALLIRRPGSQKEALSYTSLWDGITLAEIYTPDVTTYETSLQSGGTRNFTWGWCATTQEILTENLGHLTLVFTIDDQVIPDSQMFYYSTPSKTGLYCGIQSVLVGNWQAGRTYTVEVKSILDSEINDGLEDYAAGTFRYVLTVTVGS